MKEIGRNYLRNFLKNTRDYISQELKWYVDAAFMAHHDMKSHTDNIFTLGKNAIISNSNKQKSNMRSSTEAELYGVKDKIRKILWSKKFIE